MMMLKTKCCWFQCDLIESNGMYSVDADLCSAALAQKIYDEINSQKKRELG